MDPASAAAEVRTHAKEIAGVAQLFARVSDGTIYQITPSNVVGSTVIVDAVFGNELSV